MPTRGRTLRVQRIRVGVKQGEMAARMGVHRNTVKRYEELGEVPVEVVRRYLATLATFVEKSA